MHLQEKELSFNLNPQIKVEIQNFTDKIWHSLFYQFKKESLKEIQKSFKKCVEVSSHYKNNSWKEKWESFYQALPKILEDLKEDANYFLKSDPAAKSIEEILLAYPGFYAITIHRLAHQIYCSDLFLFSRIMNECAHKKMGIDIHPGAKIASPIFIDHATGIVIGETAVIHPKVKIFQGVTLGAISVKKKYKQQKRHPTVEKNVCIYANATILGGDTVIGENSIINGNVFITKSTPKNSIVYSNFEVKIKDKP